MSLEMIRTVPKSMAYWLLLMCVWIIGTAIIGAITRLTDSGLSMMTWDAVELWWPSSERIDQYFSLYQETPESSITAFTREEFVPRFFWEWFHRNWGRFLGLLSIGGLLYYGFRRRLTRTVAPVVVAGPFLIGFQGFLGWFMVYSGFENDMGVSHYRLALHLGGAFLAYGLFYWTALRILEPNPDWKIPLNPWVWASGFLALTLVYGAFTAGLNAADASSSWPNFHADRFFPRALCDGESPWALGCWVNSKWGVHFVHRTVAIFATGFLVIAAVRTLARQPSKFGKIVAWGGLAIVTTQFIMGIWIVTMPGSIMNPAPAKLALAVFHQFGGLTLFTIALTAIYGRPRC